MSNGDVSGSLEPDVVKVTSPVLRGADGSDAVPPTRLGLTTDEALRMVAASQAKAAAAGAAISTAVVDEGGHLLALARMEQSPWLTADSAHALAHTAAGFRTAGAKLVRFAALPWFQALTVQSGGMVVAGGGSLPIKRNGTTVGAIACSGATDELDLACAEAGMAALEQAV